MKKILIIDGTNIFIRNYAAIPSLSNNGQRTGGIYGTLTSLSLYIRITEPDKVVFVWDGPNGSVKRRKIIDSYKDGRKPIRLNKNFDFEDENLEENKAYQEERLKEYLNSLPIHQLCIPDIEADDVIAYLVNSNNQDRKIIVSSDKDFYQLLDDKTIVLKPQKKDFFTRKTLLEEFSIYPHNFALARAIVGDNSDNLPGVKGVGHKRLLKFFPFLTEEPKVELEQLFEFCEEKGEKYNRFLDAREVIINNLKVMQLSTPLISISNINKINECVDHKLTFSPNAFRVKLVEDGIEKIGESFFRNFRLLEIKGK